jgi:predicted lipid-binding transport protein (Tim44 family)
MRHRHRTRWLIAVVGVLAMLVPVPFAAALAGGGSSGFGGGGGGGGGGFGGGGFGGGGGVYIGALSPLTMGLIVLLVLAVLAVVALRAAWFAERVRAARRRRAQRDAQIYPVALDAALVAPIFDPDAVRRDAAALFVDIQAAWTNRDRRRLHELVGDDLMLEWERRLDDFDRRGWHNIVEVLEGPLVQYINLVNAGDDADDRIVVFVEAVVSDYVQVGASGMILTHDSGASPRSRVGEYWTLTPHDGHWMLISIEQPAEGEYHLHERPVPRPEDDARLRDDTFLQMAAADRLPDGFTPADLINVEFADDARAAALDLSLADPRFSLDVLETSVRQVLVAWSQAVDGADTPLEAVATRDAVDQLLYESDSERRTRVVVRGPMARKVEVAELEVTRTPPRMRVNAELGGFRYVEDRDTVAVVDGSKDRPSAFVEQFTLELVDDASDRPWRVVGAAKLPGTIAGRR